MKLQTFFFNIIHYKVWQSYNIEILNSKKAMKSANIYGDLINGVLANKFIFFTSFTKSGFDK